MTTSTAMTPARTATFALAAGLAVGNLYLAQPLIRVIAHAFGVGECCAAVLVTVTQVGYALGIFLIVPLGDVLDRRKLVPGLLGLSALMLCGASIAPRFSVLLAALACVGLSTVSAQILAPLGGELAQPEERGRVVGTIAAGSISGILLSRTVSGVIADLYGWRTIYAVAAVLAAAVAALLRSTLPRLERRAYVPYSRLLRSVFTTVAEYRTVLVTLLICAANFAVFSLFWTALTYLLSAPPFGYGTSPTGCFGLAGLAGALAARRAGLLHDRGWSVRASGAALCLLALTLIAAWFVRRSALGLIVVVVLLDIAVQTNLVLGQTCSIAMGSSARSRLNTAFVVSNFLGGAAGSAGSGPLWALGGWAEILAAALGLTVAGWLVWAIAGSRLLAETSSADAGA